MLSVKPWKIVTVMRLMFGVVICFCSMWLVEGVAAHQLGLDGPGKTSFLLQLTQILSVHGAIVLSTWYVLASEGISWSAAFGFARETNGRAIRMGIIAALVFLPVGMVLQWASGEVLSWLHINLAEEQAVRSLREANSWLSRGLMTVFAVVIAPVAEEILFRGVFYAAIKQMGYPRLALWGTSLFFALIHGDLGIFVPLTVLAVVLAKLYERTDNLWANIAAHATFNICGVVMVFLTEHGKVNPS